MATPLAQPVRESVIDDTNHDLVHTLSVRMDAGWHDLSYRNEARCEGCQRLFDRLQEMDREAVRLLTQELAAHVRTNKFPLDLTD